MLVCPCDVLRRFVFAPFGGLTSVTLRRRTQTQAVVVHIWMIEYHSVSIVPVPWMATGIHHRDWTCKMLQFSEIHNQEENARPVSVSGQAKHVQNRAVQHLLHMFTHFVEVASSGRLAYVKLRNSQAMDKVWRCVKHGFKMFKLISEFKSLCFVFTECFGVVSYK